MATAFESSAKSLPRQPPFHLFPEMVSDASFGGHVIYSNVLFHNWTTLDRCNYHNNAFASNPSSSDSNPFHTMREIQQENVEPGSLMFIDSPDPAWVNFEDCVDMDCTGIVCSSKNTIDIHQ